MWQIRDHHRTGSTSPSRYLVRSAFLGLTVMAITAFLWVPASASQGPFPWSPAENLSTGPIPAASAYLALDPGSGDLDALWVANSFLEEEVVGRHWRSDVQSWGPEENLSNSEWRDQGPVVFYDPEGKGHQMWTRRYAEAMGAAEDGTDLMWRYWDGADWSAESVLLHVDAHLPGTYGLILTEGTDATLLFVVWPGGFRQSEFRDGAWSELTPWNYNLGVTFVQVLVADDGAWHIAAYGPNNDPFAPWYRDAYYLNYDGELWSDITNISAWDGTVTDVGIAFDNEGKLHYLWSDPLSPESGSIKSAIWERMWDGEAWTPNSEVTADNEGQAINGFSLTTDTENTLHLAWSEGIREGYYHTNLGIYYRTGDADGWGPERPVHSSTVDSRYPVLVVGEGHTSLVWQEGSSSERDVLFSRQLSTAPRLDRFYLPVVGK